MSKQAGPRQYRMTNGRRKHTYLPRGQENDTLHTHANPSFWKDDGLSSKDKRFRVYRCQVPYCQATMTQPA